MTLVVGSFVAGACVATLGTLAFLRWMGVEV